MEKYFDNKKKIILSLIYSVLLIFCGSTFARWIWESTDEQRTDIAFSIENQEGGYSCSADGGGEIIANEAIIVPAPCTSSENVIMREISTSVEIEKDGIEVMLDLWLEINDIGLPLTESTNFKYVVTDSATSCTTGVISTGNFNGKTSGNKVNIFSENFLNSDFKKVYLYIWLDQGETNVETANQYFNLSLNGSCSGISSNIVEPVLDDGMIPVVISDDGTVTTIDKDNESWYDYSQQKWANIVLVNENATDSVDGSKSRAYYLNNNDVVVNPEDILAYYTWIPRYKYRLWSVDGNTITEPKTIDILFESKSDSFSNGRTIGSYRTHPAFWWDFNSDNNITQNEMLPGIWVGKFETTGTADIPTVLPNTASLVNQSVSEQFLTSLKFANGMLLDEDDGVFFYGNSVYGLTDNIDSHMMKNSEWGAVAYLSHSKYGINNEIRINNYYNNGTMTGCGASIENETISNETISTTCGITYGSTFEYPQSTTGNITGVYDMSGGAWEYVMGNYNNIAGSSGFDDFPKVKYYDNYEIASVDLCTIDICGGHALSETSGWYDDRYEFLTSDTMFFMRGGGFRNENKESGIFYYSGNTGEAYIDHSFRSVLIPVMSNIVTLNMNGGSSLSNSSLIVSSYTSFGEYELVVPVSGKYKLEVWGAQGGSYSNTIIGGYGGYSTGIVTLSEGDKIYVNVGGQGIMATTKEAIAISGGYNGGGQAFGYTDKYVGSGGGASHIATSSGVLSNFSSKIDKVLIVAGGGGGSAYQSSSYYGSGGAGGGSIGLQGLYKTSRSGGTGGTQIAGGTGKTAGTFGQGGIVTENGNGGGGGYYGGGGGNIYNGGGGGSGYIGNGLLLDKYMYCYECTTSDEEGTLTYSTTNVSDTPVSNYAKIGEGAAIVTLFESYGGLKNVLTGGRYDSLPVPYRYGYEFMGWYTEDTGGQLITSSTIVSLDQDHTLYAHWDPSTEYIVSYDANSGNGAPDSQIKYHGHTLVLSSVKPTRENYRFLGWSTDANATSATYSAGGSYTANEGATLYAIWEISPVNSYSCANENSGSDTYLFTYTGNCTMVDDGEDGWRVKFLSDGTLTSTHDLSIDVFLVGGGAGGKSCNGAWDGDSGGDGGGGGYTFTAKSINLDSNESYEIVIGSGGSSGGGNGTASQAFNQIAAGGSGRNGGSSGGGHGSYAGTYSCGSGGNGSSDGGGSYGQKTVVGPNGETGTTREFGEPTGDLYAGGGGGGGASGPCASDVTHGKGGAGGGGGHGTGQTQNGLDNTGGGGRGCAGSSGAGKGGSGIVVIRNAR